MKRETWVSLVTFFTSTTTLICCALPAIVAGIAGAAAVGGLVSAIPWLIPISKYKTWLFSIAAILLVLNYFLLRRQDRLCVLDETGMCAPVGKVAKVIYWSAVVIYVVGFFFAYILPWFLYGFESIESAS